jgi:hypothetical protein
MRVLGVAAAIAIAVCPAVSAAESEPGSCETVVGAWEYEPPGTGRAVSTAVGDKITFAYVLNTGEAGAGEYTCEERDGKVRAEFTFLYHSDPSQVGSKPELEFEVDGDEMRWWFLNADGERGPVGAAKRVR